MHERVKNRLVGFCMIVGGIVAAVLYLFGVIFTQYKNILIEIPVVVGMCFIFITVSILGFFMAWAK
jgi:hypothetical protein